MAFTQLLALSLLAASATAQHLGSAFGSPGSTFGSPGTLAGGTFGNTGLNAFPAPNLGFPQAGGFSNVGYPTTGSRLPGLPTSPTGYPSSFPSFGNQQQNRGRLATVHATNKAGDHLYLTIEETRDNDDLYGNPFGQSPFGPGRNPYSDDGDDLRVHGVFVKAGAQNGVTSPDSLHGTFAMVVTRNGNIDGYCIGTGEPYQVRSSNPYNPYNPFSGYGNNPYSNPFSHLFPQGQQHGEVVLVSTPLHASTGTSTIEGRIRNVRLTQLYGRSIHVCADTECKVRTDLCGTIRRDDKTVEEFKAYQQHHATIAGAQGQTGIGFGPATGVPYDPFAATAGGVGTVPADNNVLTGGNTAGGGGGLF